MSSSCKVPRSAAWSNSPFNLGGVLKPGDHGFGEADQLVVEAAVGRFEDGRDLVGPVLDGLLAAGEDLVRRAGDRELIDPALLDQWRIALAHVVLRVVGLPQALQRLAVDVGELTIALEDAQRVERLARDDRPDRLARSLAVGVHAHSSPHGNLDAARRAAGLPLA